MLVQAVDQFEKNPEEYFKNRTWPTSSAENQENYDWYQKNVGKSKSGIRYGFFVFTEYTNATKEIPNFKGLHTIPEIFGPTKINALTKNWLQKLKNNAKKQISRL